MISTTALAAGSEEGAIFELFDQKSQLLVEKGR
jgi:hypothetical protein